MTIHSIPGFSIYFGSANDRLMPDYYLNLSSAPLLQDPFFAHLKQKLSADHVLFLRQTHSETGLVVDEKTLISTTPFKTEGDYLITRLSQVAIGVMTADCLPIVLCDTRNGIGAVVHAGWRGSVAQIAVKALRSMQKTYNSQPKDIAVFFGPCARVCCYEVSRGFELNLEGFSAIDRQAVFAERENKLFFNVPLFNQLQLEAAGISQAAISNKYALCTMCNKIFYSSRRDNSGRQMTVVCIE